MCLKKKKKGSKVEFMIYDWDKDGGHDYLGQCELMLQSQPLGLNIEHIMNLTGMTKQHLCIC
jgi:Ca2+-dependent lipid-binding protein